MEKYESKIKVVKASAETLYAALSDMNRIKDAVPAEASSLAKDAECSADECSFTLDKIGRLAISIAEKTPASLIKYAIKSAIPVNVFAFVQIKEAPQPDAQNESRIKVTLNADVPLMLKPLLGSKLQEAVDKIAEMIAKRQY